MKNRPSLYALLENVIDYAGLFPPAGLSLDAAIAKYVEYSNSADSWILGPFVIPVGKISELPYYADLFIKRKPLRLSVVGRKSQSVPECISQLKEDLEQVYDYVNEYHVWSDAEAFELPLPAAVPNQELLEEISLGANELGMKAFCEVSILNDSHWNGRLCSTLDAMANFNSLHNNADLGVKLRTGGIKAELFPSSKQVAAVIILCRNRGLPLKFTAGLHHPIRMYREEVHAKMHGFLNIFLAGMLAYHLDLGEKEIEKIISDENPDHFTIADDYLAWQDVSIGSQEIKKLRENSLCSFGSCSFDEPREELWEVSKRQEGIK